MKKTLALLLALVMVLALAAGCGSQTSSAPASTSGGATQANSSSTSGGATKADSSSTKEKPLSLRYGNAAVVTAASSENAKLFCKTLEEVSGGMIKVEYIGESALGNQTQHYAMIKEGTLDFMQSSFDSFASLENGKDFTVVLAPYIFDDQEHLGKFVKSDLCKEMLAGVEKANNFHVVGICTYAPPRCLNSTKPISSVDQVKALKIRVPNSTAMLAIWKSWGAQPQVLAGSELYSAMENGLIDAQDNDLKNTYGSSFQEVAKYYTETKYIQQCYLMFISGTTWNKLTDQQKAWIEKANDITREQYTEIFSKGLDEARKAFVAAGGIIVDCNLDSFRQAAAKFAADNDGVLWSKGLYQKIRDLNK